MATGDITKEMVSDIRDRLSDQAKLLVKTDKMIHRRLTYWQKYIMTAHRLNRLLLNYPLSPNLSRYGLERRSLTITKVYFNEDIQCVPIVTLPNLTAKDSHRVIVLSNSDTFRAGVDTMYVETFIRPDITNTVDSLNDPLLDNIFLEDLKCCYLSEFRAMFPQFEPIEVVDRRIAKLGNRIKALNMGIIKPVIKSSLNFM